MTQSFNLSQLANNLDSSGRLDAADGLVNAVPLANGGTGATTASAARTNLDVAQAIYAVPSGGIIMWSGSIATIPTGWLLCNGASGTPDLRDRFVVGAGTTYAVGSTGGSANATLPVHSHSFADTTDGQNQNHVHGNTSGGTGVVGPYGGGEPWLEEGAGTPNVFYGDMGPNNVDHTHTFDGTTDSQGGSPTNANLPPYYALAFIMKT
jgi:microcystin-dependent protein